MTLNAGIVRNTFSGLRHMLWLCVCISGLLLGCQKQDGTADAVIEHRQQGVILRYAPAPLRAERLLSVNVDLRQLQPLPERSVQHVKGVLRGINFDMGVMPLVFQPDGALWRSEFMLGACTEPQMQWELQLVIVFDDGTERTIQDRFVSQR